MTVEMTADVRTRLDAHLDAVEDALRASGRTREQRRGIVDDLEAQITDMLANCSATPALADLEAVLQKLDPPAAYREGTAAPAATASAPASGGAPRPASPMALPQPPRVRYSRTAIWGFVLILVSLLPLILTAAVLVLAFWMTHRDAKASRPVAAAVSTIHVESPDRSVVIDSGQTNAVHMESPDHRVVIDAPNVMPAPMPKGAWGFGPLPCLGLLAAPLALAGTVLGWIAFFQIRASRGMIRGTGLALFDGLFYPVVIGVPVVVAVIMGTVP